MMGLRTARILVTGGVGFVESFVAEKLVQPGVAQTQISVSRSARLDLRFWYK
jgi:nucleoside-diphosphate-sugar epimerase